ncbi:hypothetical protein [Mucilaginibacter corticis]|uniref:hypothetical protein n=1 Tax=Mucilaginibacter corticis TaxID=2597670 RepID=UPI001FE9116E|nr:hypothetical protein [Mucilaginibacter corticis]
MKEIISNCKKATFLIEKKQIGGITMREEMALQLHLACCSLCRVYEQQSIMINDLIHKFQFIKVTQLDDDLKKEMQKQIAASLEKIN